MGNGNTKPTIAGKPLTVVFTETAVDSLKKLMRRAKRETPKRATRNAVINRAVETAAAMAEEL